MDNWDDTELARDIAVQRASSPREARTLSSRREPEEQAIQRWLDDGGSSMIADGT